MRIIILTFIGSVSCSVIPDIISIKIKRFQSQISTLAVETLERFMPEAYKETMIDMITKEGYPVESHYVTTSDGYILNMHRIPKGKNGKSNGKVVFLFHGILASSAHWVLTGGQRKSLGYVLADIGYDVWMGNARGNTYSRNHTALNPDKSSEFWKFSWHQIGNIDLPTMIDYVLKQTGVEGVYYCGHSQGTTSFYVMTSTRPEYNAKIKAAVSLAPIAYMNHMTSPLMRIMAFWDKSLEALTALIGVNEYLPSHSFLSSVSRAICAVGVSQILCKNALFSICGFSHKQMDPTLLASMMAHSPAGASTRQLLHHAQEIKSGKFRQYDFGIAENKMEYGSITPPDYDLSKITAPVYLIYSRNDWLAAVADVKRLCVGLPNCAREFEVADPTFNHLDFIMGIDAPKLVYNNVVDMLAEH